MDLNNVYRLFHPTKAQYTFFSVAHGTLSKTDHILGHKGTLSKYKKIEITPSILSYQNALNKNSTTKTAAENTQIIGG
jgi:exonuclease III